MREVRKWLGQVPKTPERRGGLAEAAEDKGSA